MVGRRCLRPYSCRRGTSRPRNTIGNSSWRTSRPGDAVRNRSSSRPGDAVRNWSSSNRSGSRPWGTVCSWSAVCSWGTRGHNRNTLVHLREL